MDYIKSETVRGGSDAVKIMKMVLRKYSVAGKRNFGFKTDRETVPVRCEGKLLESLFENLIKNAVEATKEGDEIKCGNKGQTGQSGHKNIRYRMRHIGHGAGKGIRSFYTTKKAEAESVFLCAEG